MLLSDIIKELEAKGHTDIKMVSNRFGQMHVHSHEQLTEKTFNVHAWYEKNGKLESWGTSFYNTDPNDTF